MSTLFWISVFLLAYTYVGYPLLVWSWGVLCNRAPAKSSDASHRPFEPRVSIVFVAHNEEARIADRIENLLALDYPRGRLEIVLASDASTDKTVERAQRYRDHGVRVIAFNEHRGKPAVLNDVVPRLNGEIVVLMDVRQRVAPDAVHRLVQNFRDPRIGGASGELFLLDGDIKSDIGDGVGFYWRYEKFIRCNESKVDSTVGVTGAIYAIRHSLFRPIPNDTILDDVLIPMHIVRQGYRVVFDSGARAYDRVCATAGAEFTRKVRTIAGNFQLFFRNPWLLHPLVNRIWFQAASHKLLRLLGPFLLLTALTANLLLLDEFLYRITLVLQLFLYSAGAAGQLFPAFARKLALVSVAHAFCLLNFATLAGFLRYASGRQQVTWKQVGDTPSVPDAIGKR